MLLGDQILGYCTNVHPYQDVAGMVAALREHAGPLRQRLLGDDGRLGVGLWLPEPVARQVAADPGPLRKALDELGLQVFTVNAFPQGAFHGQVVKDAVFLPGWADPARLRYTLAAAEALAALLPAGATGSLSTHTGAWRPWGGRSVEPRAIAAGLLAAAEGLAHLSESTGRRLVLALEPEPFSFLETTEELVAFFAERLHPVGEAPRQHLGMCFDACHQAVLHEDMARSVRLLREAGVPIFKVQVSSALRVPDPAAHRQLLEPFAGDRWFHQVLARDEQGELRRWHDLPLALADPRAAACGEWRVHYHVPVFAERIDDEGHLLTTRPSLEALLREVADPAVATHLEVETYSFDAIPRERRRALGAEELTDALEQELRWTAAALTTARARRGSPN